MASHILTPMSDKQKRYLRKLLGVKKPFAVDAPTPEVKKVREYLAPIKPDFVPRKPRGRSGCRMSHEKRLLILQKADKRREFFAGLGVVV